MRIKKYWPVLVFGLGLIVALYPLVSQIYYRAEAIRQVQVFQEAADSISPEELKERIGLARAYNQTLDPSRLADPYSEMEKEGIAEYARMLEVKEQIGYVHIPRINETLPVYAGTSSTVLQRGAGHLEGTSLPVGGINTHTVITAHRGLPEARLFTDLDKMVEGDVFYIHNIETVLAYQVDRILTVEPWDFEPVLVVEGEDYATLLTCTPYMVNSHRLLVRGHRVEYTPPVTEDGIPVPALDTPWLLYLSVAGVVVLPLLIVAIAYWRRVSKSQKELQRIIKDRDDEGEEE